MIAFRQKNGKIKIISDTVRELCDNILYDRIGSFGGKA